MESVHWNAFNSMHGNSSASAANASSSPAHFNFNRALHLSFGLKKNSSFNELASANTNAFDSQPKGINPASLAALSTAVLAASNSFLPSSTNMSPFFHSIPFSLSRTLSDSLPSCEPGIDPLDSCESQSLCLSPDDHEREIDGSHRRQSSGDTHDLDTPPSEQSPRSDAESDEWSVPSSADSNMHESLPILKTSSLMDIAAMATQSVKQEELSDAEDDDENENDEGEELEDNQDDADNEEELQDNDPESEVEAEHADEEVEEEEHILPVKSKSKAKPKAKQHGGRGGSRRANAARRAPISSAARLASQKRYDEKRRSIYRGLYTELKDAIRLAQQVSANKNEKEKTEESKKGKKKKKKKAKEIEDLSTRELLLLASNTIQQLQNQKDELNAQWKTVRAVAITEATNEEENECSVKDEKAADRKKKRRSNRNDRDLKLNSVDIKSECQQPPSKRLRPTLSGALPTLNASSLSAIMDSDLLKPSIDLLPSSSSSSSAAFTSSISNWPLSVKIECASHSSSLSSSFPPHSSPLLLLGSNSSQSSSTSATSSDDDLKRRSIFRVLLLHLRSLLLSSPFLVSLLQSSSPHHLFRCSILPLVQNDWSEEEISQMKWEKMMIKGAEMISAMNWIQEELNKLMMPQRQSSTGRGNLEIGANAIHLKQAVHRLKVEMEDACRGDIGTDGMDECNNESR